MGDPIGACDSSTALSVVDNNNGSGYLISTADNRPVEVFGLFSIPATITSIPKQEDVAGLVHLILASSVVGLALLHAAAALKHHFIDKDRTLKRIFGK